MPTRVLSMVAVFAALVPAAIAVVVAPVLAVVILGIGAVAGLVTVLWIQQNANQARAVPPHIARHRGVVVAAGTAGGGLVVTGLAVALGPAVGAVLWLAVLAAVAVWVWRRPDPARWSADVRRARDRLLRPGPAPLTRPDHGRPAADHGRPPPHTAAPVRPAPTLVPSAETPADLPTARLCLAWQRTYFALLDLPPGAQRDQLVRMREQVLDEIERRDPDGFTRWLEAGARAGSDPGRYLAGPQ